MQVRSKHSPRAIVPDPRTFFGSHVRVYHKDREGVLHSLQNLDLLERVFDEVSRGLPPKNPRVFSPADRARLKKIGLNVRPTELDFVIEFPWNARNFITVVAAANDKELRRRVLVMALEPIRRTPSLREILAAKGLRNCAIRENPNLAPGHAPYENFIDSLLDIIDARSPARENLFELLLECAADEANKTAFNSAEKLGVRIVFHGTNHSVMDAILNSGLDPCLRSPHLTDDYFGIDYETSIAYSRRKTRPRPSPRIYKLLVFMILVEPVDPVPSPGGVKVASNRFQLPLAELTLDSV